MKRIFYLNDGEMGVLAEGVMRPIPSARRQQYIDTMHNLQTRNAWKYEGVGAKFQMQHNPYEGAAAHAESLCRITAIAPVQGHLLYALQTPEVGGFYLRSADAADPAEDNWLSERGFAAHDVHVSGDSVAFSVEMGSERHIALMDMGSTRYRIVTQGDTCDSAPFLSADGRTLYCASSGYARNENGMPVAKGPSSILRIDLRSGELTEPYAQDDADYLRPKVGPDGALYVIRRPYDTPRVKRVTMVDRVKNIGAFFKGMGKVISIIGDPEQAKKQPQIIGQTKEQTQRRMLEGALLDIACIDQHQAEETGIVPDTWVLMKETPGGLTEVCKGVADYDFDGDALIVSDGRRIVRITGGRREVLGKGSFISRISVEN